MSLPSEQYAFLSERIYHPLVAGSTIESDTRRYAVLYVSPPSATNYRGAVVRDIDTGQLIVANKGTDPSNIHDVNADLGMVMMGAPTQWPEAAATMREALALAKERNVPLSDISATGHSLGGALAQLQAAQFGVHAETFNAYGAASQARGLGMNVQAAEDLVVNHRMYHDPVSAHAEQLGRVVDYMGHTDYLRHRPGGIRTPVKEAAAALGAHGISNFWDSEHNRPAAVFAHNYMEDLHHSRLDDLPPGMPLDMSLNRLPWGASVGPRSHHSLSPPAASAGVDELLNHLCAATETGDDHVFQQALGQVARTDFCTEFHAHAAERVAMQDQQLALEAQLQQTQSLLAQQMEAPSMSRGMCL
ncbi:lipase family protein [Dyella subtropica]|uniref:lipase family protein n=1 Tax=Dyella subtropica TaxID=2992127 RepID=UPI00224DA931|nr:hypothetical protein [Dyella subtropica]